MITVRALLLAAVVPLAIPAEGWPQVLVIANLRVKSSSASKTELREVFTGEATSLKDGSRVAPVLLRPGPIEDEFVATFVSKSDAAFRAGWRSLVLSGQAEMPRSFDSEKAVVDYVGRTPGSIGFISNKTPHEGVKVLEVK